MKHFIINEHWSIHEVKLRKKYREIGRGTVIEVFNVHTKKTKSVNEHCVKTEEELRMWLEDQLKISKKL
jgi:hypothetical protein